MTASNDLLFHAHVSQTFVVTVIPVHLYHDREIMPWSHDSFIAHRFKQKTKHRGRRGMKTVLVPPKCNTNTNKHHLLEEEQARNICIMTYVDRNLAPVLFLITATQQHPSRLEKRNSLNDMLLWRGLSFVRHYWSRHMRKADSLLLRVTQNTALRYK